MNGLFPYYFDIKFFFSALYRSFFDRSKINAKLGFRRFLFLILFVPFYLLLQAVNVLCTIVDEIFFRGYKDIEVKKPLFIVGVPRSGTTFLHRMLSKDEQFTAIKSWEMIFAPTITQKLFWRGFGKLDALIGAPLYKGYVFLEKSVASDFNKIHKVGLFETEEDEVLFLTSFTSCYLYFFFPDYRLIENYVYFDEKLSPEMRQKIMGFRHLLIKKHMYVFGPDKIYMTKNPADCGKIASIFDEFPDAEMVYLVRTPYECVPSVMNLYANMYNIANGPMDNAHLKELARLSTIYWYQYAGDTVEKYPEEHRIIVKYSDLVAQPKATAEKIYATLNYEMTDKFHQTLEEEEEKASKYTSKHHYDVSTHGLTVEEITENYASVFSRYEIETV